MNLTTFDRDDILSDFLTDYIDQNLDRTEKEAFEQFLAENPEEQEFARKALEGKKALSRLAGQVKAPEDFEARLALRITLDGNQKSTRAVEA